MSDGQPDTPGAFRSVAGHFYSAATAAQQDDEGWASITDELETDGEREAAAEAYRYCANFLCQKAVEMEGDDG